MNRKKDLNVSVVIAAAGKGSRMNMDANKQFIDLAGMPVIAHTLRVFEECSLINDIVLVVNSDDIVFCKQGILDYFGFQKVRSLVAGGSDRQGSVFNGLSEVAEGCDIVLIHDGARPFIDEASIAAGIEAAAEYGAAGIAVPVKDTIKISDEAGFIDGTVDRNRLWAIQTPQCFRYDLIMLAHRNAAEEGFRGTDDAVLVERMGIKVKLVRGSYYNIKITTQEDLIFAEAIANCR